MTRCSGPLALYLVTMPGGVALSEDGSYSPSTLCAVHAEGARRAGYTVAPVQPGVIKPNLACLHDTTGTFLDELWATLVRRLGVDVVNQHLLLAYDARQHAPEGARIDSVLRALYHGLGHILTEAELCRVAAYVLDATEQPQL